jgi:hypothetical protein
MEVEPEMLIFFESPVSIGFLYRLVFASHIVMRLIGACGIRLVHLLLELTRINQYAASSYSAQQKLSIIMEEAVVDEEKKRLAEGMEPKKITVCQDEIFHPEKCLLAIESVSNFILAMKYFCGREGAQSTRNEGKDIVHYEEEVLGAHHSPRLYPIESALVKRSSVVRESRKNRAEKAVNESAKEVGCHLQGKEAYINSTCGPVRFSKFNKRIQEAQEKKAEAMAALNMTKGHQERIKETRIQGISEDCRPYNFETATPKSADENLHHLLHDFLKLRRSHLRQFCQSNVSRR